MRTSKPIILFVPALLIDELEKYLEANPCSFKYQASNFYYLIHYLALQQLTYKKQEYFSLSTSSVKALTSSSIGSYVRLLRNGGFIVSDGYGYEVGVRSYRYKLNPKYIRGFKEIELSSNDLIHKRILKRFKVRRSHDSRLAPYLIAMKDELMKLEFDYLGAAKWIDKVEDHERKLHYLISLSSLRDKRLRYFKRNSTNKRLDTNLTNLKSDLRQFIIGDYVSIDLKNSQPFLLGVLLNSIILNNSPLCWFMSKDKLIKTFGVKEIQRCSKRSPKSKKTEMATFFNYFNSVISGTLYDEVSRLENISRQQAKEVMFKVLFSRNEYYKGFTKIVPFQKEKESFARVFPIVYEMVCNMKKGDHKKAIHLPAKIRELSIH